MTCTIAITQQEKPTTWYRTSLWNTIITPVQVRRTTPNQLVLINERRRTNKHGPYTHYFPTWQEARDHLIKRAQNSVQRATRDLEGYTAELASLLALVPPTEET